MEVFLYLSTRFSKDKPGVLLKALIFRRKRYDVLLKEEKPPSYPLKSLEIAEITGKPHNDVLKAIRKMEQAWVKVTQGNFSLSTYSTFETASLRYFRSKKLKQVWFFPHLIVPLQLQIPNWE